MDQRRYESLDTLFVGRVYEVRDVEVDREVKLEDLGQELDDVRVDHVLVLLFVTSNPGLPTESAVEIFHLRSVDIDFTREDVLVREEELDNLRVLGVV